MKIQDLAKRDGFSKYRDTKPITGNYNISINDYAIVVVATTQDITLTLPLRSTLEGLTYQVLEVVPIVADGFKIRIQTQGADTFPFGNTWFDLPSSQKQFELGLHADGFNLRRNISVTTRYFIDDWASSNFSTSTVIPWELEDRNTQDELIVWDGSGRFTVKTRGTYELSAMFSLDSTGGGTWNAEASIWVNGIEAPRTKLRTGNYGNEDSSLTGIPTLVDLNADDYVEIKLVQNNLTGQLLYGTFNLNIRL